MKVILLRDVDTLGTAGQIVTVADGYGRNALIPKRQALLATDANVALFESRRRQHEAAAEREKRAAEDMAVELEKASLTAKTRWLGFSTAFERIIARDTMGKVR